MASDVVALVSALAVVALGIGLYALATFARGRRIQKALDEAEPRGEGSIP